jgi:autotransporter-associated beta strand protein
VGTNNTGQGYQTLVLDGTSSDNRVTGTISDASDVGTSLRPLRVTKSNTSTWTFSGTNTYSGSTTVSGGILVINGGSISQCLPDTNSLTISGTGKVQLNTGVRERAGSLYSGAVQLSDGKWGSTTSTATFKTNLFLGTGILYVNENIPASGTILKLK